MSERRPVRLSVTPKTRSRPSFCDGSPQAVGSWASTLQTGDAEAIAEPLLKGLMELNQCKTPFAVRFRQLEVLRPTLHYVCTRLSREPLRRPLHLGRDARRTVILAQTLQNQLAGGYKSVIGGALQEKVVLADPDRADSPGAVAVTALHRAVSELGYTLLRALQLYTAPPNRLWEQLHELSYLAEQTGVTGYRVRDPVLRIRTESSISDVCLRPLLLGSAQPNMLRQETLVTLFTALESWSGHASLVTVPEAGDARLLVDLAGDAPPVEANRHQQHEGEDLRAIDAGRLLLLLQQCLDGDIPPALAGVPGSDSAELLGHVIAAWGSNTGRAHARSPAAGRVELCVGLPAAHFHAGGGLPLYEQLRGGRSVTTEPDAIELDPFAGSGDVGGVRLHEVARHRRHNEPTYETANHPIANLELTNVSPNGYGLTWQEQVDSGLQTGELVALRSPGDEHWSIAVVRWCRSSPNSVQMGVELLARRATTAAIRSLSTDGEVTEWDPALVLPEIEALSQPPFLVTVSGRFVAGQKVAMNQFGDGFRARLDALERDTPGFAEFRFHELGGSTAASPGTGIEVEFFDVDPDDVDLPPEWQNRVR